MKVRKVLVTSALSLSLAFSSFSVLPAFAASFNDTVGLGSEMSIAKLVSLGLLPNTGSNFNPDQALSRADFASLAKALTGTTVSKSGKTVTYAELCKVLANGLGLKASWTKSSVDYLYFLDRKGVVSIDADLDAAVTRAEAAAAFDKFISLKGSFKTVTGVVAGASATGLSIISDTGREAYPFAKDVSAFIGEQNVDVAKVSQGIPVDVVLNNKGQIVFVDGDLLNAKSGAITLDAGLLNGKEVNLNAYFAPLPSQPKEAFSLALLGQYQDLGISFSGQLFYNGDDYVSAVYPYISKIEGVKVGFSATGIVADWGDGFNLAFNLSPDVTVTIDGADSDLDGLKAYKKAGAAYTATVKVNDTAEVVSIEVTSDK